MYLFYNFALIINVYDIEDHYETFLAFNFWHGVGKRKLVLCDHFGSIAN